jgi:hypothetical protein
LSFFKTVKEVCCGGYAKVVWDQKLDTINDPESFVFSLGLNKAFGGISQD